MSHRYQFSAFLGTIRATVPLGSPVATSVKAIAPHKRHTIWLSEQAMQGAVRSLIKRGYLQAKPDPDEVRAQKLTHTQKGRELVATLDLVKSDLHAAIEAELRPKRLDAVQAALDATTRVCADRAQKP